MFTKGFNSILVFLYIVVPLGQGNAAHNLLVVSKHEPATSGNLVPKSQQTLLVSKEKGKTGIQRFIFPNQINESFLPQGFLSDPVPARVVSPTAISPVTTTFGSGFIGITKSINDLINAVNKKADILIRPTESISKLNNLIKPSANKEINTLIENALGVRDKTNTDNNPTQQVRRTGSTPVRVLSVIDANNRRRQLVPFVIRKNRAPTVEPQVNNNNNNNNRVNALHFSSVQLPISPRSGTSSSVARPVVTNNRVPSQSVSSNVASRVPLQNVPSNVPSRIALPRVPSNVADATSSMPSRGTNTVNRSSLLNTIRTIVNRQRALPTNQQTSRNQPINRNTPATRPQTVRTTAAVTRQRQQEDNDRSRERCPSRDDCPVIVPTTCRRPTFITDDNGRRICRGCDEDRCAFGGFEQRWGRGFG